MARSFAPVFGQTTEEEMASARGPWEFFSALGKGQAHDWRPGTTDCLFEIASYAAHGNAVFYRVCQLLSNHIDATTRRRDAFLQTGDPGSRYHAAMRSLASLHRSCLAGLGLLFLLSSGAFAAEPANPKATPQARRVLDYFHELRGRKEGRRILSGQFTDFGNGAKLRIMERIHERTGQWPALIGVDYADFGRGSLTWKVPNQVAIEYWQQGGLVTVMAHMYNPANPKGGGLRDPGVDLATLLQPGTETHTRWMQELELIAAGLQQLKEAGVVVLWRPFHEMNGGWFWWGAKDPDQFIAVWRHMFDYFSETKALDNLLWVYGPNHGQHTATFYAGDRYVDLLGLDAYTDFVDREHIKGYDEIVALPKPFGFTEYGPHGSRNPPGNYDYRRFIDGLEKDFPQTCFFMCWNAKWSLAANENTKELLNHPSVINRGDLPATLFKAPDDQER